MVPDVSSSEASASTTFAVPSWVGGSAPSASSTITPPSWVDPTASSFNDIDLSGVLADLMIAPVSEGLAAAPLGFASGGTASAVPPGLAFMSSANSSNANTAPPPGLVTTGNPGWGAPVVNAPRAAHPSSHAVYDDDDTSSVSSFTSTRSVVSQASQISSTRASPVPKVLSHTGPDGKKWRAFHVHTDRIGGLMGKGGSVMNKVREQSVDTLYLPLQFVRILLTI